jgi:hypothetical protein
MKRQAAGAGLVGHNVRGACAVTGPRPLKKRAGGLAPITTPRKEVFRVKDRPPKKETRPAFPFVPCTDAHYAFRLGHVRGSRRLDRLIGASAHSWGAGRVS